jgi:hypothetical protein
MALPPLQDILALLPDNTQGLIEPSDLRQEATTFYQAITENIDDINRRLPLTGGELTGALLLHADPVQPEQAATKNYVDNYAIGTGFVQKTGDTMTGDLELLPTPANVNSAVTKGYADNAVQLGISQLLSTIVLTDGTNTMNGNYTPALPQSVATKQYVDDNSAANPNALVKNPAQTQIIQGGLGLRMTAGFTPSDALDLVTKDYVDNSQVSGGQLWREGVNNEAISTGEGVVVEAGQTYTIPDTDDVVSFIVTDGSDSADADNPVVLTAVGKTFSDGTSTFELDVAGASVEFALVDNTWHLVNFGRILNIVGNSEVVLWNGLRTTNPSSPDTSDITFAQDITEFDEIVMDWALTNVSGSIDRVGSTPLSSSKIAELIARPESRWSAYNWQLDPVAGTAGERNEIGLGAFTATTATPELSSGNTSARYISITKIVGKKQAKVYRDVELTETANTWAETQTFAKLPIGAMAGGDVNGVGTTQSISPNWSITKGSTGNYTVNTTESGTWVIVCQAYGSAIANYERKVSVIPSGGAWTVITQSDATTLADFRWFFTAVKTEN